MQTNIQTRRQFLKAISAAVASTVLPGCTSETALTAKPAGRPNVLLIMTDDQGFGDISSHGNDRIDTPVMDKIAADGVRFDRFYVSPVCAPTRASLLTGRYHLRCGTVGVTRGEENMRAEEVTIAEILKRNGYATGCFGKWHNGANYPHNPNGQGFDEFLGFCAGHWNNYFDTTLEHNGRMIKTKGYITDVLTDAAIEFVEENKDKPFFCYVPYNAPHSPWQVPDKYFDKYKTQGLDNVTACAYGMCENLDDNIGRLLKRLDELKLKENTIVLFLTDNGANSNRFNRDMKGRKGSYDEGGVRVPLFIRWPGKIKPGRTVSQIASHIDLPPTIVSMCGLQKGTTLPLDGVNLVPLIEGKDKKWPDRMIFTFPRSNGLLTKGAVRTQRWRAVKSGPKLWRLYDMHNDPKQVRDVKRHNPKILEQLISAYEKAFTDVTNKGFEPIPIHIGYNDWPVVEMQAHLAHLHPQAGKGISYHGRHGWANDWITNWTDTEAYAWWPIEVVRAGRFEISLKYICSKENVGAEMSVEIGDAKVHGLITAIHDPAPVPSPDRVARKEAYEKVWAVSTLGIVELAEGPAKLKLKALRIPGSRTPDIKAVKLKRL